mmetsp:Transcript_27759/g.46588  ORF Transcript_27759/g.46588 Transcript_27759/m.46588 type:complete len:748 (-) Transcript_27759:1470-3713(-)
MQNHNEDHSGVVRPPQSSRYVPPHEYRNVASSSPRNEDRSSPRNVPGNESPRYGNRGRDSGWGPPQQGGGRGAQGTQGGGRPYSGGAGGPSSSPRTGAYPPPRSHSPFVPVDPSHDESGYQISEFPSHHDPHHGSKDRKDLARVIASDPKGMTRSQSLNAMPSAGSSWATEPRSANNANPAVQNNKEGGNISRTSSHHNLGNNDISGDGLSPTGGIRRVLSVDVMSQRGRDWDNNDSPRGNITRTNSRNRMQSPPPVVWAEWKPKDSVLQMSEKEVEEIRSKHLMTVSGDIIPNPVQFFDELNIDNRILIDISAHNYIRPTPIQSQAFPVALMGHDILGFAETGSGKTAAFCIPMINHILQQAPIQRGDGPIALILAPTRELAQQIDKEAKMFSVSSKLRGCIVVGGSENMQQQRQELRGGVEFVVATPGRFIQHLQQNSTSLNRCSYLVMDEADRMLDMGFEDQIREIIGRISPQRQTLLFSATMPEEIEALAAEYLKDPIRISIGTINKPTDNVFQAIEFCSEDKKLARLIQLIKDDESEAESLRRDQPQILVFVETKIKCETICESLRDQGIQGDRLHADRTQPQREAALQSYRDGIINVLVATDLASRGLDVTGITHVINYDLPKKMEDYVHRIGRTGRAGSKGKATSFYDERDMDIVVYIRRAIQEAKERAGGEKRSDSPVVFAAGKAARRREKETRETEKARRKEIEDNLATLAVDDKYKHMLLTPVTPTGEAPVSDAWDD